MLCEEWAEAEEVPSSEHHQFLAKCMQEELEARGYYDEQATDEQLEMEGEGDDPYAKEVELDEPAPEAY
ncbi:hypothetical protein EZV61_12520 [Corallincola luteus]|nr:hypothetical protein [Corallincola luteus]TCI02621.1 hypothetical protein EZV61_12520 [Corallincola luteus]